MKEKGSKRQLICRFHPKSNLFKVSFQILCVLAFSSLFLILALGSFAFDQVTVVAEYSRNYLRFCHEECREKKREKCMALCNSQL